MSEIDAKPQVTDDEATSGSVSLGRVFLEFLIIGASSFGGVVPYLRGRLVTKLQWLRDKEFVELLSISQSLPGLNATNMAILVGQKLSGALGAIVAVLGMCLPGGVLMFIAGIVYRAHGDHIWATAALKGVAAASVGLILSTVVQLSRRSFAQRIDFVFVALTVIAVDLLHQSVLRTLIVVGLMAILWHRPRNERKAEAAQ
ncbi:chromate transporter [Bradyrhizobium sp. 6(2017)]|uniref:chromate transporter n=1 Tax=Bradyrhizobium sp. 6(2017) TaxID=1197460 RepID=UPI0013E1DD73|nr:chromate transporter [Bradyrhizobium sp. 6(2017)]QIG95944.1 chromate transporter [Bradyrhizobium sp. 6(2017)]